MSFKFPRPKPKHPQRSVFDGLPQFKWKDFKDQKEIGDGSYGVVKVGHYNQQDGEREPSRASEVPAGPTTPEQKTKRTTLRKSIFEGS